MGGLSMASQVLHHEWVGSKEGPACHPTVEPFHPRSSGLPHGPLLRCAKERCRSGIGGNS